ncbi:PilN domain-containing protein [Fusibacter sp. JL216-2]|uniref:PilN domain-containing protein n=1 Tax=Fusibacter sp. JL216-2 TaxID=3071453 RepID=UPI003D324B65
MKDINLLPSIIEKSDDTFKLIKIVFSILLGFSLSVTGVITLYIENETEKMNENIGFMQNEILKYKKVEDLEKNVNDQSQKLRFTFEQISNFEKQSIINHQLLIDISSTLPENTFLKSYSVSDDSSLSLSGVCADEKDAVYLVHQLKTLDHVESVKFKSLNRNHGKKSSFNFTVSLDLN